MIISWGDYDAGRQASITLTAGIDPDELNIEIGAPIAGNTIDKSADFTIDDEQGGSITLVDMRAIDGSIIRSTSARTVRFRAHDRRWRWSMKDPLSGDYNTKDAGGNVIDNDFKKSARELGEIILDFMGETGYTTTGLPTDQYPESDWDTINPAQALQDLTDLYAASIVLKLDNTVAIYAPDDGQDELPQYDQQITARDETQRVERIPGKLTLVGGYNVDQIEIELAAVGFDPLKGDFGEGGYDSMDDMSWKPLGGYYPGYEEDLAGDALNAARETGFKYYSIPALVEVNGVDTPREQILKYITDEISETEDRDGQVAQAKPYCTGAHATELAFSSVFGLINAIGSVVPVGFRIDKKLGMVIFDEPVFAASPSEKMIRAQLNLQVALKMERFEQEYNQPDGLAGTSAFVNRPDIRYLKIEGVIQNPEILQEADKAMDSIAAGFVTEEPLTLDYTGIASEYAPDGRIEQVTYSASITAGPTTTVSWKTEHDDVKPTRIQRKAAINTARSANQVISKKRPAEPVNQRPNAEAIQITSTATDQINGRMIQRKIKNMAGISIPAGSFVLKDGVDADGYIEVIRPDTANISSNKLMITSPYFAIRSGGKAIAMDASQGGPAVKYSGTEPTDNQDFGTQADSFEGLAGNTGFTADGVQEDLAYASPFRQSGGLSSLVKFDCPAHDVNVSLAGGPFDWVGDWQTITPFNPVELYAGIGATSFKLITMLSSSTSTGGIFTRSVGGSCSFTIKGEFKYDDDTTVESVPDLLDDTEGAAIWISTGDSGQLYATYSVNFDLENKEIKEFRLQGHQTSSAGMTEKRIRISQNFDSVTGPVSMTLVPYGF